MDLSKTSYNMLQTAPSSSEHPFAEGYLSLVASMPIIIVLILAFTILILLALVAISAQLSRIATLLEDQSPSAAAIKENKERAHRVTSSILVSILGVTLGVFTLFMRFETNDEFTSQVIFVTGIGIILCSIAVPVYQSFFKKTKSEQKSAPESNRTATLSGDKSVLQDSDR